MVHPHTVEPKLFDELDLPPKCVLGRCSEMGFDPVALRKDHPQVERLAVEREPALRHVDRPEPEIAVDRVHAPTVPVDKVTVARRVGCREDQSHLALCMSAMVWGSSTWRVNPSRATVAVTS